MRFSLTNVYPTTHRDKHFEFAFPCGCGGGDNFSPPIAIRYAETSTAESPKVFRVANVLMDFF